jgi:hypothetical protein
MFMTAFISKSIEISYYNVEFEVLTAAVVKSSFYWDVILCNLAAYSVSCWFFAWLGRDMPV